MDYEKKYNEALKWMRELYPGLHGATKEDAEHYFPELRENEDERIRECICMALTDVDEQRFKDFGTTLKDCLSWLEKQKEQKPAEIDFEDWDTLGYIRDIVRKHIRRDEEFNVLDKWLTEHYVNQKPAWSEEEQKFLRVAISCTYDRGYLSVSNWLKSLRPSWKPSKEQIEALRYVAYEHGNSSLSPYSIANKTLASLYEQLKKL